MNNDATVFRRLIEVSVVACALVALSFSLLAYRAVQESTKSRSSIGVAILETIASDLAEQEAIRQKLGEAQFVEQDKGPLGSYLAKVRRDGLPAHAEMRRRLESISQYNVSILTLLELYEPYAQTTDFKKEAGAFRAYAPAWNDRWSLVMEYFMAGGNLPSSDVPVPTGFAAAVQAEIGAAK